MADNIFREVNGKYMHNNEELDKAEFDRRKSVEDEKIQRMRGPDRSKMDARDRARSAFDELNAEIQKKYKKGGKVKSASARADGIAIRGKTRA